MLAGLWLAANSLPGVLFYLVGTRGERRWLIMYEVVEGSESSHCCFTYSVVDRLRLRYLDSNGVQHYRIVCECWSLEDARRICDALNRTEWDND